MIIPDTNLLVYAYDSTAPQHQAARDWWESCLSGSESIGIPWIVVLAFTRLMTHPHICSNPLPVNTVREITTQWLSFPHVRLLNPSDNSLETFYDLLTNAGMGGNLSTDALIALHAREHSARIHSNDRDFDRFSGIRTHNPLK